MVALILLQNCTSQERTKRSVSKLDRGRRRAGVVSAGPLIVNIRKSVQPSNCEFILTEHLLKFKKRIYHPFSYICFTLYFNYCSMFQIIMLLVISNEGKRFLMLSVTELIFNFRMHFCVGYINALSICPCLCRDRALDYDLHCGWINRRVGSNSAVSECNQGYNGIL